MLKKALKISLVLLPWILGVLFLAMCAGIVFISETFQTCISAIPDQSTSQNFEKGLALFSVSVVPYLQCTGAFVHKNGEAIVAAFTVILALSTIALWSATKRLVRGAEKTAERQLRAYVFVSYAKISESLGTPKIKIRIKNFGQTPAYGLTFWIEGVLREVPLSATLQRLRSPTSPQMEVAPTGALDTEIDWDGPITEPNKQALANRTKAIYVFGRVDYRDTFGSLWHTEFRFVEGGEFPAREGGGEMAHAKDGNKAT